MVHKPSSQGPISGGVGYVSYLTGQNDHLLVVSETGPRPRPVERRLEAEDGFGTTATTCTSGTWSVGKKTLLKSGKGEIPM